MCGLKYKGICVGPTRFIPLDGPGAKKLGGPPHAQKNILKSVPPQKKRAGPQKVGHGHTHQMYFTHFFLQALSGKKCGKSLHTV